MAILQLSRITHRKGLSENLPQLAGAELGWVLDERKLFIGNGTIIDGAPVIGNTEILTQFSDILSLGSTYTYKGEAAGYVVSTGENDEAIVRSLQSKYDDIASIKDFGAVGDGETDDSEAINRALYELFCRESNVEVRRGLFFPAGTYKVSNTIKIPPHARLWGEGLTSSIIKFISDDISVVDIEPGKRYAVSLYGATNWNTIVPAPSPENPVPTTADDIFIAQAAGTLDGTVREVTEQVVETSDSLHQTGPNIGNNGAVAPTGIEMSSMAVYSTEENTLLKLDSVTNSSFHYVGLHGPILNPIAGVPSRPATSAVEIVTSTGPTHDITISKLDTFGTTWGLRASGQTKGVVLENSGLDYHYQGVHIHNNIIQSTAMVNATRYKIMSLSEIQGVVDTDFKSVGATYNRVGETFIATGPVVLGTPTGTVISMDDPGPTGIVISRNIFDNIAFEGVHFHNTLFNSSSFNVFYNVANNFGLNAVAPVIHMETDQCISIGDLFAREDESLYPRIDLKGNGGVSIDGTHSIHLGSYERQVGLEAILPENTITEEPIFLIAEVDANSFRVDYNIKRDVGGNFETRMGRIYVSNDGTAVNYNDEYTESDDTGVILSVTNTIADSELQFTTTAGNNATLNYSIVRLG